MPGEHEPFPPASAPAAGLWRYRRLLGLPPGPIRYPLPVGGTPLVAAPSLQAALGLPRLLLKDETRSPSGSNKDRATALVLEFGLRADAHIVTAASMGNVAVSLALGAAAAGIRAVIFVPAEVDPAKLRLMLAAAATVLRVAEGYHAAFRLSQQAARELGWLDRNTGVNPATLAAKKTVAFEIFEQLGRRMPDVVVAPVGDGPTLVALGRGFRELVGLGLADSVPRLIGVQAEGAQPVVRAFETGRWEPSAPATTVADGIRVAEPVFGQEVVDEVRSSGGSMVAVADSAILDASARLAQSAGMLAEPAGATALAGVIEALGRGLVAAGETVVALVTGSGLKTQHLLRPLSEAIDVGADLEEVRRALRW